VSTPPNSPSPAPACCKAAAWYDTGVRWLSYLQHPFLLILRLYIGYECAAAGWGHLHNIDGTASFFKSMNIPYPRLNVYIAGSVELFGGMMLLAGLLSRLISIPLVFNFAVAILAYENYNSPEMLKHPFILTPGLPISNLFNDDNFTQVILHDTAFPYLFVSLLVLLFGPGAFSIDHLILKRLFHRKK